MIAAARYCKKREKKKTIQPDISQRSNERRNRVPPKSNTQLQLFVTIVTKKEMSVNNCMQTQKPKREYIHLLSKKGGILSTPTSNHSKTPRSGVFTTPQCTPSPAARSTAGRRDAGASGGPLRRRPSRTVAGALTGSACCHSTSTCGRPRPSSRRTSSS